MIMELYKSPEVALVDVSSEGVLCSSGNNRIDDLDFVYDENEKE